MRFGLRKFVTSTSRTIYLTTCPIPTSKVIVTAASPGGALMENVPFLFSPIVSGLFSIAFPVPSDLRAHRFFYAFSVGCLVIIIGRIGVVDQVIASSDPNFPTVAVLAIQILSSLAIIFAFTLLLGRTDVQVKIQQLASLQKTVAKNLTLRQPKVDKSIVEAIIKLSQDLSSVNRIALAFLVLQYISLSLVIFPKAWLIFL